MKVVKSFEEDGLKPTLRFNWRFVDGEWYDKEHLRICGNKNKGGFN